MQNSVMDLHIASNNTEPHLSISTGNETLLKQKPFTDKLSIHSQCSYELKKFMITMSYHAHTTWALSTNGNKAQR